MVTGARSFWKYNAHVNLLPRVEAQRPICRPAHYSSAAGFFDGVLPSQNFAVARMLLETFSKYYVEHLRSWSVLFLTLNEHNTHLPRID
jgi:hypothetical protein